MTNSLKKQPDPIIKYNSENVYSPSEDTYLMIDYFRNHISQESIDGKNLNDVRNILDLCTGTGIIAIFFQLMKKINPFFTPQIFASDILEEAIKCARLNEKFNDIDNQITYIISDGFKTFPEGLKHSFDIILFNPPYLPSSKVINEISKYNIDYSWDGGKEGYELIIRFIDEAREFLNAKTSCFIYFICSSRTNLSELEKKIKEIGYTSKVLDKKHIFFEDIILYRLET